MIKKVSHRVFALGLLGLMTNLHCLDALAFSTRRGVMTPSMTIALPSEKGDRSIFPRQQKNSYDNAPLVSTRIVVPAPLESIPQATVQPLVSTMLELPRRQVLLDVIESQDDFMFQSEIVIGRIVMIGMILAMAGDLIASIGCSDSLLPQ
ncbi:hypothetical protein MPSEU_000914100 [Mayamaea pseudoterrestris]|nr:hypothetical protein MPSEU_000914100 [Mayamaea pseudoterrestris]